MTSGQKSFAGLPIELGANACMVEDDQAFPGVHRLRAQGGVWCWIGDLPHPEDLLNLKPGGIVRTNGIPPFLRWIPDQWPAEWLEGG